jgi:PAS domain S-box-containing protein
LPIAKVLIVDDDRSLAELAQTALQRLDYQVMGIAPSGEAAIRLALETCPDLILMDIHLVGPLDGIQAAEAIRRQLDIPVVYVTAATDNETLARLGAAEPFGYLVKPFRREELGSTVRLALYKHDVERRLRHSQTQVRQLSQAMAQAQASIVITDLEGRITYVNPYFTAVTGYTAAEAQGQTPRLLKSGQTPAATYTALWRALHARQTWRGEFINRKKNGEIYYESAIISPILDENGAATHYVAVKEDITQRKRDEAELRRLNEELEAHVASRTLALSQRADELEALARLSHVLRRAHTLDEMQPLLLSNTIAAVKAASGAVLMVQGNNLVLTCLQGKTLGWPDQKAPLNINLNWRELSEQPILVLGRTEARTLGLPATGLNAVILELKGVLETYASMIALVTLKTTDLALGVLALALEQPPPLGEPEQRLLISIADIASNAFYRANLMDTLEQRVTARTQELTTLYNVASLIGKSIDLGAICGQALDYVMETLHVDGGMIHLLDEENGMLQAVAQRGLSTADLAMLAPLGLWEAALNAEEPILIHYLPGQTAPSQEADTSSANAPGFLAYIGTPVHAQGRSLGVVSIFGRTSPFSSLEALTLLAAVADQLGVAVVNASLRRQAEAAAVLSERQRLARELHDSVTQLLYSQVLFADAGQKYAQQGDLQQVNHYLERVSESTHQALKEMRLMIYELRPSALASVGLVGALQQRLETVEQRAGLAAYLQADPEIKLPIRLEAGLYRIAQEALNNALKHSGASEVNVALNQSADQVQLEIHDNGCGFDPNTVKPGVGLTSMRERAELFGGALALYSYPGEGTHITVTVPRPQPELAVRPLQA